MPSRKPPVEIAKGPARRERHELCVVLGPPGYGKTTLVDEWATAYVANGGRVWVVDPSNAWPGHPGRVWSTIDQLDTDLWRLRCAGPGLLVLDDADYYMRHPTDARLDLMTSFRHWQKDVLIVARRPQGIPKDAIANADSLALFHCREVHARKYIGQQLGDLSVLREIPKEPYRYLYVRQDAQLTRAIGATKPRTTKSAADLIRDG